MASGKPNTPRSFPRVSIQPSPLGIKALPAAAWEGLFRVALKRLERCKPGWAKITAKEAAELQETWYWCEMYRDTLRAERWLSAALDYMEQRPLTKGKIKQEADPPFEALLRQYNYLRRGLQRAKRLEKSIRPRRQDQFWREQLRILFADFGPVWRDGIIKKTADEVVNNITPSMIAAAGSNLPSEAAYEIVGELWGWSPEYLSKVFVRARQPLNPLRLWAKRPKRLPGSSR